MLTAEHISPDDVTTRRLRLGAVVLGLLGAVMAIAVPVLPVSQDTARIVWPQADDTRPVNAPLVAFRPEQLTASVPCVAARTLDARTGPPATLMSTTPYGSPEGAASGMALLVADGQVTVFSQGEALGVVPAGPGACTIEVFSDADATTVTVGGEELIDEGDDVRPQVIGIYSDFDGPRDRIAGLSVEITPDTRFQTTPGALKITAMTLAVLATIACLVILVLLDRRNRRAKPRISLRRWFRPTKQDGVVAGVLAAWIVIGGLTSDDGYIRTIVETRGDMGYIGNYYRWFNVPEAPFGWPYELYAAWIEVSTAPVWLRIPAALMGLTCWLLISRELLPRLGRDVRRSSAAAWAAAAVFLAFWLPYDNGLRLEPVVAVGSLLTLTLFERAIATRRLAPFALSLLVAALTVASAPTGFITVAPFIVGAAAGLRLLRAHAREIGWATVLAPILSVGLVVLVVIFADQTLAAVLEATKIRTDIGPNLSWYEEFDRYELLFRQSPDGALPRRFPVILMLLCIVTCFVVLLRRGRIPGAGLGPSRRLVGTAAVALALLALTPTKWTHHFGSFAPIGAALAALAAVATGAVVVRSERNRWWFASALVGVLAFSAAGPNAPWYVSRYGVPWFDKAPSVKGIEASTVLIVFAGLLAVVAFVLGVRDSADDPGAKPHSARTRLIPRWAMQLVSAPLVLVAALLVFAEVGAMLKAVHKQRDSYSLGEENLKDLYEKNCSLSDKLRVEPDRVASALVPIPISNPADAAVTDGFEIGKVPEPEAGADQQVTSELTLSLDEGEERVGSVPEGINTPEIPAWSSFTTTGSGLGELRTPWYILPTDRLGTAPLVTTVAGQLGGGIKIVAEFANRGPNGMEIVDDIGVGGGRPTDRPPAWRDYRNILTGPAASAQAVRLVVEDREVTPDGWIAISAPRVPVLSQLTDLVGPDQAVMFDWPVGFVHPCLRPYAVRNGIAELPEYRLVADDYLLEATKAWSSYEGGGPLGWLEVLANEEDLPGYLEGDLDAEWGAVHRIVPRTADTAAPVIVRGEESRSGLWSPGPLSDPKRDSAAENVVR